MLFFWDPHKAQSNFKKHGISFEMAQMPPHLTQVLAHEFCPNRGKGVSREL
jgi:uncharacterized DUF497 family protein